MAKKTLKDAATAGPSVFDQIASGNVQDTQNALNVQNTQNTQDADNTKNVKTTKAGRPAKYTEPMERLSLKIPVALKEYLQAAAYRESSPKKMLSLTEYLCQIIREDMERHQAD